MRFGVIIATVFLAVNPFGWDQVGPLRFGLISAIGFGTIAASLGAGDARPQPLPRWAVLGWTITLLGLVVSTALSPDLWHALIGTPDRHFGLATWFLLAGLFAVASIYPNSIVPFVTNAVMLGAAGAGIWALLEVFGISGFASDFAGDRAGGTFQQPAYLGAAMVLATPICLGVAFDKARSRAFRVLAGSTGVLAIVALGLSQARGAWLAATITLAATIVQRRMWRTGVLTVVIVGLLVALTPVGARIATLGDVDDGVVAGRIDEWQVGARALTDTPTWGITGHGPEGYRIAFGRHVDDAYVIEHGRDVFTDRAHNVLLDTMLAGGFIAGAGLLLLYGGLAITAFQRLKSEDAIDVGLGAAVLGSILQQLVLFPLAELDPALWIIAGLLVTRRPSRATYRPPLFRYVSAGRRVAMLGAGFLAAMSAVAGLSDVAADRAVKTAVASEANNPLELADRSRSRRPDSIRYDFITSRVAARPASLDGFLAARDRLDDGLSISPHDPALRIEHATTLLEIARRSGDENDLNAAIEHLGDLATGNEPRHPDVLMRFGIASALNNDTQTAIDALGRAARLDPTNVDPLLNLAVVHLEAGNLELGEQVLAQVAELAPANARAEELRREFSLRMIEPNKPPDRLDDMEATLAKPNRHRAAIRRSASSTATSDRVSVTSAHFDTFYASTYEDVARALSITLGDAGWGREAADEAMTRAYDRWSDVSTYTNPGGWVYRVGLNWARSWHRKLNRKLPWSSEVVALPQTHDHELDNALMNLDIKYRSVVVCRYLLDWSTDETAQALDIAPGTVKSRLSTGLSQLRDRLDLPEETNPVTPSAETDAS